MANGYYVLGLKVIWIVLYGSNQWVGWGSKLITSEFD